MGRISAGPAGLRRKGASNHRNAAAGPPSAAIPSRRRLLLLSRQGSHCIAPPRRKRRLVVRLFETRRRSSRVRQARSTRSRATRQSRATACIFAAAAYEAAALQAPQGGGPVRRRRARSSAVAACQRSLHVEQHVLSPRATVELASSGFCAHSSDEQQDRRIWTQRTRSTRRRHHNLAAASSGSSQHRQAAPCVIARGCAQNHAALVRKRARPRPTRDRRGHWLGLERARQSGSRVPQRKARGHSHTARSARRDFGGCLGTEAGLAARRAGRKSDEHRSRERHELDLRARGTSRLGRYARWGHSSNVC